MEEEHKEKGVREKKNILNKIIDFFFSNDERKWLIPIIIMAIILRFIVVNNVTLLADEMVHGAHAINIMSSGVINVQNECPVWFYLTDMAYRIFGVNAFAGRFLSFFFGILTIPLVYIISRRLFNKKIAIIASFLLAISAFHIIWALIEMDEAMIFFILLSFYFFIKDIKTKERISYLSVIFMCVAILIKPIALPFIPAFVIYFLFITYKKQGSERQEFLNKNIKRIIVSVIIFLLFMTPIFAYNYILYKQKGITDVLFSRFFNINREIYSGLQGYDKGFLFSEIFSLGIPLLIKASFFKYNPAISALAVVGILLIFLITKYKKARFFVLLHILPFFFLLGSAQMQTHFVPFMPMVTICASVFIIHLSNKFSNKINPKKLIYLLLILIFIVNMIILFPFFMSRSGVFKLREYTVSTIQDNDIVVVDARTYRGRIAWVFNDKAYLESSYFPNLLNLNQNMTGNKIPATLYFIECAVDDCGWGTIRNQPEFNDSMEQIVRFFKQNSEQQEVIYGGGVYEYNEPYFIVYKTTMEVSPVIYDYIYQSHDWFYYPVRWAKNDWYDKYSPQGAFQVTFNSIGKLFLWIAIILAIISPIFLLIELFKNQENNFK